MKKSGGKKLQFHKRKFRAIAGFAITLGLLCLASYGLFAKYYAGNHNKGVATASSLYFSSNILKTVKSVTGEGVEENYPILYNTTPWDGTGECIFDVQIRNYQNQLLYNDKNLDITYKISFQLESATDGGTYVVSYNGESHTITQNAEDVAFSSITLNGGLARENSFQVSVRRPESQSGDSNYRSVGIRVTAIPQSPSYVSNSGILGGILYASMVSTKYQLTASFDKITKDLENYSGFPCTITYMPDEDNSAHEIKIMWDSRLEIDQFYSDYQQAKKDGKTGTEEQEDGTTWNYMVLTMQPYSSVPIAFYRAAGFAENTTLDTLKSYIKLEDVTKKSSTQE